MLPKSKFSGAPPRTPLGELTADGLGVPYQELHPTLSPLGLISMGLRVKPITELATLLRPNVGLYEVRIFFRFRRTEKMDSGDKGADGGNAPHPENFWARTARVS